jgi:hypothetical protein
MRQFLPALLGLLFVACVPTVTNDRASPFPIATELRSFPTWRATIPAFERLMLEVLKSGDPNFADATVRDRQGQPKMREVLSVGLERQRTAVMFVEEEETIVLGVLDLENPRQGAFAIRLERLIAEAADKLFVRVVFGQVTRVSYFAGVFPYDAAGRDLPVWAVSLETALPVMLAVVQRFDERYGSAFAFELTDLSRNRLRVFQVRNTSLERDRVELFVTGEADRVALGVFEADSGGKLIPGSQADKLEDAVIAAMDALYKRSPD